MKAKEAHALKKGDKGWVGDSPFRVVEVNEHQMAVTTHDRYTRAERAKKELGPNDAKAAALVIRYSHADVSSEAPFEEKPPVDIAKLVSGSPADVEEASEPPTVPPTVEQEREAPESKAIKEPGAEEPGGKEGGLPA